MPDTDHAVPPLDEREIREAERRLEQALASPDRTAWVDEYTEDAVFDGGGHVVEGREALLAMAEAMAPMSFVTMRPLRTLGSGDYATVWFEGSWISGDPATGSTVHVRGVILWQRCEDGRWRVALEHIS